MHTSRLVGFALKNVVIPAKAGTHRPNKAGYILATFTRSLPPGQSLWVPAFAGMTNKKGICEYGRLAEPARHRFRLRREPAG